MKRKFLSAFLTAALLFCSIPLVNQPVSGAGNFTITNPYANVNWSTYKQYKAALHTHSTHSDESGMTAAMNGLDVMSERHYSLGFHVVAVTDHSRTTVSPDVVPSGTPASALRTPLSTSRMNAMAQGSGRASGSDGMIFIPNSNERSHTLPLITSDNHHVGSYFVASSINGSMTSYLSNFDTLGGYAVINHPSRYTGAGWSDTTSKTTVRNIYNRENVWKPYADLYSNHSSLKGLEIVNEFDYDSQGTKILWDKILQQTAPQGKLVWGYANDDAHHVPTIGYAYNLMLMPSLSMTNVRTAMDTGAVLAFARVCRTRDIFPVASMKDNSNNRRDDSSIARALNMPTPTVTSINVGTDTITINARVSGANSTYGENLSRMSIRWIADSEEIFTGATLDLNAQASKIKRYVRAEIVHLDYGVLYTQPFGIRRDGEADVTTVNDGTIFNLQRATASADVTSILVNAGNGTRTVDLTTNPKRVTISGRTAASDGLDIDISKIPTRAGYSYVFEITGTLGTSAGSTARFVYRRANNGGDIVPPVSTGANGAFSFTYTASHQTIQALLAANADERFRIRSESALGNIVITNLVIREISGTVTTTTPAVTTAATPPTTVTTPTPTTVTTTTSGTTTSAPPTTATTTVTTPITTMGVTTTTTFPTSTTSSASVSNSTTTSSSANPTTTSQITQTSPTATAITTATTSGGSTSNGSTTAPTITTTAITTVLTTTTSNGLTTASTITTTPITTLLTTSTSNGLITTPTITTPITTVSTTATSNGLITSPTITTTAATVLTTTLSGVSTTAATATTTPITTVLTTITSSGTTPPLQTTPATTTEPSGELLYGDVDGNGVVNINDALEILKFLAGISNLVDDDEIARQRSQILPASKDAKKPQIGDALEILKFLAGLPSEIKEH